MASLYCEQLERLKEELFKKGLQPQIEDKSSGNMITPNLILQNWQMKKLENDSACALLSWYFSIGLPFIPFDTTIFKRKKNKIQPMSKTVLLSFSTLSHEAFLNTGSKIFQRGGKRLYVTMVFYLLDWILMNKWFFEISCFT